MSGIGACVLNMKFLCLKVWPGEVCTDDADIDANDDTNDDDARRTKHDCIRFFG